MRSNIERLRVINCVNQSSVNNVRFLLTQNSFYIFELDGQNIRDTETLFAEIKKVFPQDPPLRDNCNWDALVDSLWGGLDELGEKYVAVIWTNSDKLLENDAQSWLIASQCFQQLALDVSNSETNISKPITLIIFLVGEGHNFKAFPSDENTI